MQTYGFCEPTPRAGAPALPAGAWCLCFVAAVRAFQDSLHGTTHNHLGSWLARAELDEEITEFCALSIQAILEMSEGSEFATDYLDMAASIASSPYEHAIIAEARAAHDWLQARPGNALEPLQASLTDGSSTATFWNQLLLALRRRGESETRRCQGCEDPRAA